MDCDFALLTPPAHVIAATLATSAGERNVPRGSLLRRSPAPCDGVAVEVLSTAGWYTVPNPAAPGDRGCVAAPALRPLGAEAFVALRDAPGLVAGELLAAAPTCEASTVRFDDRAVPLPSLAALRAITPESLARVESVRSTYTALFGPIGLHQTPWADEGYVGLPLPDVYDTARVEAEVAREGLDTPARREKVLVAAGPGYAHFWGADAAWSDIWARPETIIAVLRTAAGWAKACADAGGSEAQCRLQIGDLAWYDDVKPDPLGHKDHREGRCVDLRLFRTDGSAYEAWWNRPDDRSGAAAYDAVRTTAFLRWTAENVGITEGFFNDPAVLAAVPWLKPLAGHDDHVHVCLDADG